MCKVAIFHIMQMRMRLVADSGMVLTSLPMTLQLVALFLPLVPDAICALVGPCSPFCVRHTVTVFPVRRPAVFGFGTLVFNGLEIAMRSTTDTACSGELSFAHPILQAIFTFLQMHFLFVNSEVRLLDLLCRS